MPMRSEKQVRPKAYRSSKTRDGKLPLEDRIKASPIWRLSAAHDWKKRQLVLCHQDLFVGVDGLNIITEKIALVSNFDARDSLFYFFYV